MTSARATRNGTVIDASVSDLDRNGRLEVAVITQSGGRDLSGDMALFEWSGSELRARPVADLSPAEKQGYRGRDVIRLQGTSVETRLRTRRAEGTRRKSLSPNLTI
jgi:hypothetical protein